MERDYRDFAEPKDPKCPTLLRQLAASKYVKTAEVPEKSRRRRAVARAHRVAEKDVRRNRKLTGKDVRRNNLSLAKAYD